MDSNNASDPVQTIITLQRKLRQYEALHKQEEDERKHLENERKQREEEIEQERKRLKIAENKIEELESKIFQVTYQPSAPSPFQNSDENLSKDKNKIHIPCYTGTSLFEKLVRNEFKDVDLYKPALEECLISCGQSTQLLEPMFDDQMQKQMLGSFYNAQQRLPFINGEMDLRFLPLERPGSKTVLNIIQKDFFSSHHFLLLGPSGCGKTSTMLDVARKHFTIFMECSVPTDISKLKNHMGDLNFIEMVKDVEQILAKHALIQHKSSEQDINGFVKGLVYSRIHRDILARLCLLWYETNGVRKWIDPIHFLHLQLSFKGMERIKCWSDRIAQFLSTDQVSFWLITMGKFMAEHLASYETRLCFILDEAHAGLRHILKDQFKSERTGVKRGITQPILETLRMCSNHFAMCAMIAGTAMSLKSARYITSPLGKEDDLKIITEFPFIRDPFTFLQTWLDVSGVDTSTKGVQTLLEKINGRPRLVTRAVNEICNIVMGLATNSNQIGHMKMRMTKQEIFETAIESSYNHHLRQLEERIQTLYMEPLYRSRILSVFASLVLRGDRMRFPSPRMNVVYTTTKDLDHDPHWDLLQLGLAMVRYNHTDGSITFAVKEQFAIQALFNICGSASSAINDLEYQLLTNLTFLINQLGRSSSVKGNLIEPILFHRCLGHYKTMNDVPWIQTIWKRAHSQVIGGNKNAAFPEWFKYIPFAATSYGKSEELGYKNDIDAMKHSYYQWIWPENKFRADGVLWLQGQSTSGQTYRFAIILGIAFYSNTVPESKNRQQRVSTQLQLAYTGKTGRPYRSAKKQREEWKKEWPTIKPHGTVRIHILIPRLQSLWQPPLIETLDPDHPNDVVINITLSDIDLFFEKGHPIQSMLHWITSTPLTTYD